MRELRRYETYDRKEVHDIFNPNRVFRSSRGTWGAQGIARIPDSNNYIFYVTYGKKQGDHEFEEGINKDGILKWQSQPEQRIATPMVINFINYNHLINNIYLFLRKDTSSKYTYIGKLAYIAHDPNREKPVNFKWQILDWDLEQYLESGFETIEIEVPEVNTYNYESPSDPPPRTRNLEDAQRQRQFSGRHVNYSENESKNRKLGIEGEEFILEQEKNFLINNGRPDLADNVQHTAKVIGDGTGYDIKSYDLDGRVKFIEVKTTTGGDKTPFMMSINEVEFSKKNPDNYYLYRVYHFNREIKKGEFYVIQGNVEENFHTEPINFKVRR